MFQGSVGIFLDIPEKPGWITKNFLVPKMEVLTYISYKLYGYGLYNKGKPTPK